MTSGRENVSTDVGTTILLENDRVRIWEMVLQAGERCPDHRHLYDHILIYSDPSNIRGYLDGSGKEVVQDVDVGWTMYREVGEDGTAPHFIENIGTEPSRHFIVELLGTSASETTQPPVTNDRGRFEFPADDPDAPKGEEADTSD